MMFFDGNLRPNGMPDRRLDGTCNPIFNLFLPELLESV